MTTLGLTQYMTLWDTVFKNLEENENNYFQWLNEILEEAKSALGRDDEDLLPKTPCVKKRRGRARKSTNKTAKRKLPIEDSEDDFKDPKGKQRSVKQTKKVKGVTLVDGIDVLEEDSDTGRDSDQQITSSGTSDCSATPVAARTRRAPRAAATTGAVKRSIRNQAKKKEKNKSHEPILCITDTENQETAEERIEMDVTMETKDSCDTSLLEPKTPVRVQTKTASPEESPLNQSNDMTSGGESPVSQTTCSTPENNADVQSNADSTPQTVTRVLDKVTPVAEDRTFTVTDTDDELQTPVSRKSVPKTESVVTPKTVHSSSDDSGSNTPIRRAHNFSNMNVKEKVHLYEEILTSCPKTPVSKSSESTAAVKKELCEIRSPATDKRLSQSSPASNRESPMKPSPSQQNTVQKPARPRTRLRLKKVQKQPESEQDVVSTETSSGTGTEEESQESSTDSETVSEEKRTRTKTRQVQEETQQPVQPERARTRTKTRNISKSDSAQSESDSVYSAEEKTDEEKQASPPPIRSTRTKQRKEDSSTTDKKDSGFDGTEPMEIGLMSPPAPHMTRSKMRKPKEASEEMVTSTPQRTTRTKTRKRQLEEEATEDTEVRQPKRSCTAKIQDNEDHSTEHSTTDEESSDDMPSPVCPSSKIIRPHPKSFLNSLKSNNPLMPANLNTSGVRSFIRCNTPVRKATTKEMQDKIKKELAEKQKKNEERLKKRNEEQRKRMEELRKRNEEKMRRAQEVRENRKALEREQREQMERRLAEKNKLTEKVKEEKLKEEREKQKIRMQKLMEAEERRKIEEGERAKKLQEQYEEQRQHQEMIKRKKEFEEQERLKRIAEENRKLAQKQTEIEKMRQEELQRQKQIEEERAKEWQKRREERDRILQNERLEKERQELAKRREMELIKKKELERHKEMEKQRLAEEERLREQRRKQEEEIKKMTIKHNQAIQSTATTTTTTTLPRPHLNRTHSLTEPSVSSYQMTPDTKLTSSDNYDISDLNSDDDTDNEDEPRKQIPAWAQGVELKSNLIKQHYNPPNMNTLWGLIEMPDLNVLFEKKKARFNRRTSSAHWTSPIRPFNHRW